MRVRKKKERRRTITNLASTHAKFEMDRWLPCRLRWDTRPLFDP